MIRAPPQLAKANMFNYRRMLSSAEVFYPLVVLLFTLVVLALCEQPCSVTGLGYQVEYDACRSYREKSNSDIQDLFSGDVNSGFASENFEPHGSLDNVCRDSNLFCFWSRLPRLLSPEHVAKSTSPEGSAVQSDVTLHARSNDVRTNFSWSPELDIIKFCSGRTISYCLNCQGSFQELPCQHTESGEQNDATSCRGPLLYHKSQYFESQEDMRMKRSGILDGSSPHIEVSPPLLYWGQKYLYIPSLAHLTNQGKFPWSQQQFTKIARIKLRVCTIRFINGQNVLNVCVNNCFVFFPTWLGLCSAQLVLQTSSGGFLIHATGFALESPYGIQPVIGLDVSSSGKWKKNLSFSNPFEG